VILSKSWLRGASELGFVTRALAGAASRSATVSVMTPMPAGTSEADGAFDLLGIGAVGGNGWPNPDEGCWPLSSQARPAWIVDEPDENVRALIDTFLGGRCGFSVTPGVEGTDLPARQIGLVPSTDGDGLGLPVPINPLAGQHRHMGLGFTGYILVLTDRVDLPPVEPPTPAVGWLTSRFYDHYVVVVEGGAAAAWKGRALRGVVAVDTRTDLWRLLAHAQLTVDLAPGNVIARESIESLRFGTPVVVPADTVAAAHARAGGGLTFTNVQELFDGVARLLDQSERATFSRRGARYANELYGDPAAFVSRLSETLWPES
jgi:hypothetical protein